jgi:hypothetical protein
MYSINCKNKYVYSGLVFYATQYVYVEYKL